MFQDRGALHSAETAQRVPKQAECTVRQFFIGDHQVALVVPASGTERAQTPIEPPLLIHVDRAGTDVREHTAKPASLKRSDAAIQEVVAKEIAHEKGYPLSPSVPRDKGGASSGEIQSQPATVRLSHHLGSGLVAATGPGPLGWWRTRIKSEPILARSRVDGITVQVPAQVMESSDDQPTTVRQRDRIECTTPGAGFSPSISQTVGGKDIQEDPIPIGGEVDPIVGAPGGGLIDPVPPGELSNVTGHHVEHEKIDGAIESTRCSVRGEHQSAAIR